MELRKEFQAQEAALQRSLSKLRSELQKAQEEARENRDRTNRLQTSLANAEGTIKVCVGRLTRCALFLFEFKEDLAITQVGNTQEQEVYLKLSNFSLLGQKLQLKMSRISIHRTLICL